MQQDIRETPEYRETLATVETLLQPGTGRIVDAAQLDVAPDGAFAVFAGTLADRVEGVPSTRICRVDLHSGKTQVLTFGPNTDHFPKVSPDGRSVAFLSDRHKSGDFQLYLLDLASGGARPAPSVDGWIESVHWSGDGGEILLGVAGHGADIAGAQGAITSARATSELPDWMPTVDEGEEGYRWRRAWIYEVASDTVRAVSPDALNVWEAAWCGSHALAVVTSPEPGEGAWYSASLTIIDLRSGSARPLYAPRDQLGYPAGSPDGRWVAVIEAVCSDRSSVAGDLRLIDTASLTVQRIDTNNVDVTHAQWRSNDVLLLFGIRGFETVIARYELASQTCSEIWSSQDITNPGHGARVSGLNDAGDCVMLGEGFRTAPEIAVIRDGCYRAVRSFDTGYGELTRVIEAVEPLRWHAPDGIEIQGWLLLPAGSSPHPLVTVVHGGPVSHWRTMFLGRTRLSILTLLQHGYAVFLPNPRGSSGRGQQFARRVVGDMGGADTYDYLSGIDHLVNAKIADPQRLGVMGASYGGFMTSWLITQDARFAAAVAVAPVTNHVTEHLIGNIPHFVRMFLEDHYTNATGKYFTRSPIMHAHDVTTPTLNVCGALDRCTPPEESVQFHNALLENGATSVLLTYPQEGHAIRKLPALVDFCARVIQWFDAHLGEPRPVRDPH